MAASTLPGRHRTWRESGSERDRRDQTSVIGLLAMGGAAVAVEPLLVGIGAEPEIGEAGDPCRIKTRADEAGKVEHGVTRLFARTEEALVPGRFFGEALHEFGADLIGRLADRGAEHRNDP